MGFPGTGTIWMNGKLVEWKDANIHIASHVIHYGSGVFEGARCYSTPKGSACFRLEPHMRRLMESAKNYRMEYALDLQAWMNAVLDVIRVNEMKACYIRPLLYRGYEILGGITRDSIITLAREAGYTVTECVLPRESLYTADEVFFVGTAAEVTPVKSVDKIKVGMGKPGSVTTALQTAFFKVINGEVPDRHGWLTYVYPSEASLRDRPKAVAAGSR